MKEIQLTQGLKAQVDDEDYEYLNQFKWCATRSCKTFYARRGLPRVNGRQNAILMHHVIMCQPPKGFQVDHRNGRGNDNQRHNLRFVTNRQNSQNRKNVNGSSKFPGVSWDKSRQKWAVHIRINGKRKKLGRFNSEYFAYDIYCNAVYALGETVIGE